MTTLPLAGLTILDLSRVLAGPFATQILGDLGAEVIKIESPAGDDTRSWAPPSINHESVYFLSTNRNKRGAVLDFGQEPDRQVLFELLKRTDVLVENFKVGGLKQWGLDFPSLTERFPQLIYCSITGFGQTGPYAQRPGYDALVQAMGGLMSITGTKDNPYKVGVAITDLVTGLYAVIAILAAINERGRSQLGQHIDLSLLESQISILSHRAMDYLATGEVPQPQGNAHANIVPYQTFSTRDVPVFLAVGNNRQFSTLCRVLNMSWDRDARFATNPQRVQNRSELIAQIQRELVKYSSGDLLDRLQQAGIPAAPINDIAALAKDPQVLARDVFTTMTDGKTPCIRSPIRYSRTPITSYQSPPRKGEHQADITGNENSDH